MQKREAILSGERVLLAEMTEEDQPIFYEWRVKHPELLLLIRDRGEVTLEAQKTWFQRSKMEDRKMFSILTTDTRELIGHGGLVDIEKERRVAQLRITIGNPAFWGKGFGTEASALMMRYGFETLGCTSLWLRVPIDNERALKSYAKLGFMEEGREEFEGEEFLKMSLKKG